jgi:acetolactate synthase-1/2/3 large subunit
VLLFSGDGGFWYHLAELETAVRCGINAVLLINNNRSLNQEIAVYADAYGGKLEGHHEQLWQFTDASFASMAEAMGAKGIRVEKPGRIAGALEEAFSADRPCVVEVMTEQTAVAPVASL